MIHSRSKQKGNQTKDALRTKQKYTNTHTQNIKSFPFSHLKKNDNQEKFCRNMNNFKKNHFQFIR